MKCLYIAIIFFAGALALQAQTCNGSFGDPVFEETFGNNSSTGATFAGALPAGTTNYTYNSTGNTQDGYYTVTTNPNSALSSLFSTSDHTDDESGQGYMLVVNADENTTGEFYRKEVTGLCNSLVYQFSAYFLNALPDNGTCSTPIPCNVKFVIEDDSGNELGSLDTGDIESTTTVQWVNYSFEFEMPAGSSNVSVVLINNSLGGCGNDLAIDDITFKACGSLATVDTAFADFDDGVCPNDVITFTADVDTSLYTNIAYQWQVSNDNGTTWTDITGATSDSITVTNFEEGQLYRFLVFEAQNVNSPNCQIASEEIEITLYDTPAQSPGILEGCDQNGTGVGMFDFTQLIDTILDGGSTADFTVTFYNTQTNAENATNVITNPDEYDTGVDGQTIYVRVEDLDRGCINTTSFTLTIKDIPVITSPVTLQQCDTDTDGFAAFNLEEAIDFITSENYTFTFYKTEAGAEDEDIYEKIYDPTSFTNALQNEVYATVENNAGCYAIATIELVVSTSQIPDDYTATLTTCDSNADGDDTNGMEYFNLSSITTDVLSLFSNASDLEVTYYTNESDALLELNAVSATNYLNSTPYEDWLYIRIDNTTNNSCFGLQKCVQLLVEPLPFFEVTSPQEICLNDLPYTISVENPSGAYQYEWYNPSGELVSSNSTANATTEGAYTVTATTYTTSACTSSQTITLVGSDAATIEGVAVIDATSNNTITIIATGPGDYVYSLDGLTYQESPIFENLEGGSYTVYVKDLNGCGITTDEACVIAFPNYFTPNGDGVNDTWKALNVPSDCVSDSYVTIFDRYGKLLARLRLSDGWSGSYGDYPMPSDDYWYTVELDNNRSVQGHFALKR
ncbi:hypothetical protein NBRC110019_24300 [Neptunitalea chrysea]|uniref:T9SS type B sorting domain-containing protein n=1 Tax=Neptunitalea chrysea TaxID=1647581 RepID=A0A9W6EV52_9FLAO|nr:T9SS type B sorting domain-containing protein [Neptunitalea chrysea]GLB53389.1 hypothetical protein NBRC110019_24300 [Neptunitalea chrysea]